MTGSRRAMMRDPPEGGLTADRFLDGALTLAQPAQGYRAGLDAMLLAASLEAAPEGRLAEFGCGAGAALLAAAWRLPSQRLLGVEREPAMAALARENIGRNGFEARVEVREADLFSPGAGTALGERFAGVFVNPPFAEAGAEPAPSSVRLHAHVTEHSIDAWVRAAVDQLMGGASFTMIHRADRLLEILNALEGRLGGAMVLPVRPRAGAPAKRVLVRARKGARGRLQLLPGLDLHEADGTFTPLADAVFRGRAALTWGATGEHR